MVCLPVEMDEEIEEILDNNDYVIKRKGGRSLIDNPPKFSPDETCLFVISGRGIQIYDVGTAEFVRSLKDKSDPSPIVAMDFPPGDDRTLVTCTEDGSVVHWKWHAGVESTKFSLNLPKDSRVLSFDLISADKAVVGFVDKSKALVGVIALAQDGALQLAATRRMNRKPGPRWTVAVGSYGDRTVVAVSEGTAFINVFDVANPAECMCHAISQNIFCTRLAWHPSLDVLAVGDTLGRVTLMRTPVHETVPPREIRHWHQLPLAAVAYSVLGGVLLTGGAERVMVAWSSSRDRKFIPRLPAEILHIASSRSHFVASTADNSIHIVDASSMYLVGCIREAGGLGGARRQLSHRAPRDKGPEPRRGPALQYAHPSTALLLPAGPGHLHMYSTVTDSLMYTLDVTNTNIVPPERDNLQPEQIEVTEMSVGCRGQWLCTWEGRGEQERLRWFGSTSRGDRGWSLHTVVARPHRPAAPTALHMAMDVSIAVSFDDSNQLRFWTLVDSIPGYEGRAAWCTVAAGRPSGGPAGGCALSGDGSVCAAWAGARLTLWDTCQGRQKACLSHPALRPQGKQVQFGRDHHMHFVACTTETTLAVWNTLSLRLVWVVQLNTSCLIADPFSDRVAAVTTENDIFVFRMSSSRPLVTLLGALPPQRGVITSAAFAPSQAGPTEFRLYLLREQQEIFVIEQSESDSESSQVLEKLPSGSRPAPSAYSALMAEQKTSVVRAQQDGASNVLNTRAAITELLLSTPAHAQPSLKTLCAPLLRTVAASHKASPRVLDSDADLNIKVKVEADDEIRKLNKQKKKTMRMLEEESMEWTRILLEIET